MASDKSFADFIVDQIEDAGFITAKKMFGEYALYSDDKVVAFICDNKLFIKPTDQGRKYIGKNIVEAHAYPNSKLYFLITDRIEDSEWLSELIRITAKALPAPKLKKRNKMKI